MAGTPPLVRRENCSFLSQTARVFKRISWEAVHDTCSGPRDITELINMMNEHLHDLIRSFPFPLCGMLEQAAELHEQATAGDHSANLPEAICRANAFLLRFDAAIAISALASAQNEYPDLNGKVIKALRNPSDGTWLDLLEHLCKGPDLQAPIMGELQKNHKTILEGLKKLVEYRNDYMNNRRPLKPEDHSKHFTILFDVIEQHAFLKSYNLWARHSGRWVLAHGYEIQALGQADLKFEQLDGHVFFINGNDEADHLEVSPLIHHFAGEDDSIRLNNLFFLNRGTQEMLEYILHTDEQRFGPEEVGTNQESFRELLSKLPSPPIPREPRLSYEALREFHGQHFVGRAEVLQEIQEQVRATNKKYLELRAYSGMGKTAILCQLYSEHYKDLAWPEDKKQQATPINPGEDLWAFHFCEPLEGRNDPLVALKSITAQVCDGAGLQRGQYMATEANEQKQKLLLALAKATEHLNDDKRVIICIDALDEGIPAYGKTTVPGLLPGNVDEGEASLPDRVVFLISYRVQPDDSNRVDHYLKNDARIPEEWRQRLRNANPLKGLPKPSVEAYLKSILEEIDGRTVDSAVVDRVYDAGTVDHGAEFGADPFYLRFLQGQVHEGVVDLNRAESIPKDLGAMFEQYWMGLPVDHDYALHRILATVAILREYATDELAQAVINQNRSEDALLRLDEIRKLRQHASKLLVYSGDRYALFHDRFRVFLVGENPDRLDMVLKRYDGMDHSGRFSPTQVAQLHRSLGSLTSKWGDQAIMGQSAVVRNFALHQGAHHLLLSAQLETAAGILTDYATCNERLKANRSDEWVADLQTANAAAINN